MNVGDRYGTMGRLLHRIAFRAGTAQHALSDVEETLYADRIGGITAEDPVFITSLPRSGTTILLKLLWQTGRFASHTYQDMPFVLCPLLWSRYTGRFAEEIEPTERAHGDGLEVSGESPEAFEEMIWKHFWPSHYHEGHIRPWSPGDENEEFNSFFRSHMRKRIALRTEEGDRGKMTAERGYLSKNNLNIARLAALPKLLQDGTFLVPFRDPVQQASSMHRQHERFLQIHEEDDFVRDYMEAIGHHEFGEGLESGQLWRVATRQPARSRRSGVLAPVLDGGLPVYLRSRRRIDRACLVRTPHQGAGAVSFPVGRRGQAFRRASGSAGRQAASTPYALGGPGETAQFCPSESRRHQRASRRASRRVTSSSAFAVEGRCRTHYSCPILLFMLTFRPNCVD